MSIEDDFSIKLSRFDLSLENICSHYLKHISKSLHCQLLEVHVSTLEDVEEPPIKIIL